MKIKHFILSMLMISALTCNVATFAQDSSSAAIEIVDSPVVTSDQPVVDETISPTDTIIVSDPVTQDDVAQSYLKYFANPVMFMMLVALLTGLLSRIINLTAAWKIYSSWIIAAVLGIIGSLASWGMFVGIDVLHSIILALSASGFTNVVYAASGAFTGIEGKKV